MKKQLLPDRVFNWWYLLVNIYIDYVWIAYRTNVKRAEEMEASLKEWMKDHE